jgi:hypothetical protein
MTRRARPVRARAFAQHAFAGEVTQEVLWQQTPDCIFAIRYDHLTSVGRQSAAASPVASRPPTPISWCGIGDAHAARCISAPTIIGCYQGTIRRGGPAIEHLHAANAIAIAIEQSETPARNTRRTDAAAEAYSAVHHGLLEFNLHSSQADTEATRYFAMGHLVHQSGQEDLAAADWQLPYHSLERIDFRARRNDPFRVGAFVDQVKRRIGLRYR